MDVTQVGEGEWSVASSSGKTYTVRYVDGDLGEPGSYSCTCPCGQLGEGKICKHQREIAAMVAAKED